MRLAKDLLEGTSGLLRLLARTNHLKLRRKDFVWAPRLALNCSHLHYYALEMVPIMRLSNDLLRCTSDVLQFLARTNHLNLRCMDLVCVPRLVVKCSHLRIDALELAPDHASDEGPAWLYFGFTPTSGPDQSFSITPRVLVWAQRLLVNCSICTIMRWRLPIMRLAKNLLWGTSDLL